MSKTALQIAQEHALCGYAPVVVAYKSKRPIEGAWSTTVIRYEELAAHFGANGRKLNVGLLWGAPSHNRGDVDLDCWEARGLAPYFLPATDTRFGRASAPCAHWVFEFPAGCPDGLYDLIDPDAPPPKPGDHKARIVELRGPRHQTVGPGSIHESGEEIRWDSSGAPAKVEASVIERAVRKIAAATLIVRRWTPGQRQDLALCIAGALLRSGWAEKEAADFLIAINAVAREGEDDERTRKRLWDAVTGTAAKLAQGEKVWGLGKLAEFIGKEEVTDRFAAWLGLGRQADRERGQTEAEQPTGSAADDERRNGHNRDESAGGAPDRGLWRRMSTVQRKKASPLWPGYLYLGKLNLIGGDPSAGKSFLTMAIMAHATHGWDWPDGSRCPGPMNVILVSGEEDPEDSIGPRLDAVQADSERVLLWDGMATDDGGQRRPSLAKSLDIETLRRKILEEEVGLVVIDPLNPFLDERTDTNRGNAVRAVTTPLADLARQTGAAIVVVMHLNKAEMQHALYRIAGSIDFIAAARSALAVGRDPENEEGRRLVLSIKNNVEKQPDGQAFCIEDGGLRWDKQPVTVTAQQMLSAQPGSGATSKREQAAAGLSAILATGAQFAEYVYGITSAFGVGKRTVDEAKADLKIVCGKVPTPDGKTRWTWSLPGSPSPPPAEADGTDEEETDAPPAEPESLRLCNLATLTGTMADSASESPLRVDGEAFATRGCPQPPDSATMPVHVARLQGLKEGGADEVVDVGVEVVSGPPCRACKGMLYWLRPAAAGGGPVCATCHPPQQAVAQEPAARQGGAS
jgi:hypothetical protein